MSLDLVALALAKKYTDERSGNGGSSDMSKYATKEYVDNAIKEIPAPNVDGLVSYVNTQDLTNEQKQIARDNIDEFIWRNFTYYNNLYIYATDNKLGADFDIANTIINTTGVEACSALEACAVWLKIYAMALRFNFNQKRTLSAITEFEALRAGGALKTSALRIYYPGTFSNKPASYAQIGTTTYKDATHYFYFRNFENFNDVTLYYNVNTGVHIVDVSGGIRIDKTLTKDGYYADAKVVGDALDGKISNRGTEERPSYNDLQLAFLDDIPTDDHINELINTALGVIENGTY